MSDLYYVLTLSGFFKFSFWLVALVCVFREEYVSQKILDYFLLPSNG